MILKKKKSRTYSTRSVLSDVWSISSLKAALCCYWYPCARTFSIYAPATTYTVFTSLLLRIGRSSQVQRISWRRTATSAFHFAAAHGEGGWKEQFMEKFILSGKSSWPNMFRSSKHLSDKLSSTAQQCLPRSRPTRAAGWFWRAACMCARKPAAVCRHNKSSAQRRGTYV